VKKKHLRNSWTNWPEGNLRECESKKRPEEVARRDINKKNETSPGGGGKA